MPGKKTNSLLFGLIEEDGLIVICGASPADGEAVMLLSVVVALICRSTEVGDVTVSVAASLVIDPAAFEICTRYR